MGLSFDDVDDIVNCGSATSLSNLSSLTVGAWIYPKSMGEGNLGRILDKSNKGWRLYLTTTNRLTFSHGFSGNDMNKASTNNSITVNTWQHALAVYGGGSNHASVRLFLGGSQVAAYAQSDNGSGTRLTTANSNLTVGNFIGTTRTFDGFIAEAFIFAGSTLSDYAIRQLASAQVVGMPLQLDTGHLVLYLPLDDFSQGITASGAGSIRDLSPLGNHGTPSNGPIGENSEPVSYP